ncbi:FAD:protein FMN transferase [Pedobacter sp.]|nr:FAD:protein FMN transferase [Candidatus Saccharibacteria bacterium]
MMLRPSIEFDALGTHWWIELPEETDGDIVKSKIIERVMTFQNDYSRFIPNSYIGKLNSTKRLTAPPQELLNMLIFARDMFEVSEGIFNISVGGTLAQLGYGKSQPTAKLHTSLWGQVVMTEQEVSIPNDVEIDLGGFGKGWLIDTLGVLLKNEGYEEYVINGGGDILVSSFEPLEFALEHPVDSSLKVGTTRIQHGALAVSSSVKRVWNQGAKTHHHLIDPRQGISSASPIVATYVRAETALMADTMATILLITPELRGKLTARYDLRTVLLDTTALTKH